MSTHFGVLSLALLGALHAAPAQGPVPVVAIRHVTVIDGTGAAPLPDATVVIRGRLCLPKTRSCGVQGATGFEDGRAVRLTSANVGARVEGAGER